MKTRGFLSLLLISVVAMALASIPACARQSVSADSEAAAAPPPSVSPPDSPVAPPETPKPDDKTLVIGVSGDFGALFNPFLAVSANDRLVLEQIFTPICTINAEGGLAPHAGSAVREDQPGGRVSYTITIRDDLFFTDGTPVTIDDFIYGLYVRADPSFTGVMGLADSGITGIREYYYGTPGFQDAVAAIGAECEKYAPGALTLEDFLEYARLTALGGRWSGADDAAADLETLGYGGELAGIGTEDEEAVFELYAKALYESCSGDFDVQGWFLTAKKSEYAMSNIGGADDTAEISGIVRLDGYSCSVMTEAADFRIEHIVTQDGGGILIPRHYYGELTKGDVSGILESMTPMGCGPYIFGGYEDGAVTCTANADYFQGVPKTGTVRWQSYPPDDITGALTSGLVDIAELPADRESIEKLSVNPQVRYDITDGAGYGYMAMSCKSVPLYVRRAVWSLMNRAPSIEGYFGAELASVIERPMSASLAEYPADAAEYYGYSPDRALEYFGLAGYTLKNGKLVNDSGRQFVINCYIGAQGTGSHPAYAMLEQAGAELAALGGVLNIVDADRRETMEAIKSGEADMWILAWGAEYDCDKTTRFHSAGSQNWYGYFSPQMDALLEIIRITPELEERRALVSRMLDLAMEDCVELPLYQHRRVTAYNGDKTDLGTIPRAARSSDYRQELWRIAVM